MEQKIKGSTDFVVANANPGFRRDFEWGSPATLVVHEGKHERVFTESEVRELLRGMMQLIDGDPEQVLAAIEAVNAKHGLGLSDPA